jgi:hypothetical protein
LCRYIFFIFDGEFNIIIDGVSISYIFRYWDHWFHGDPKNFQKEGLYIDVGILKGGWLLFSVFKVVVLSPNVLYLPYFGKRRYAKGVGANVKNHLILYRPQRMKLHVSSMLGVESKFRGEGVTKEILTVHYAFINSM